MPADAGPIRAATGVSCCAAGAPTAFRRPTPPSVPLASRVARRASRVRRDRREGDCSRRWASLEIAKQLVELRIKLVRVQLCSAAQQPSRTGIGARSSPQAEIDSPWVQSRKQPKLLGDTQRAVVGQHHAACSHADPPRSAGDVRDQNLRRRACEHAGIVVFREPNTGCGERLGVLCQRDRIAQRLRRVRPRNDGTQIEDRERNHRPTLHRIRSTPARGYAGSFPNQSLKLCGSLGQSFTSAAECCFGSTSAVPGGSKELKPL